MYVLFQLRFFLQILDVLYALILDVDYFPVMQHWGEHYGPELAEIEANGPVLAHCTTGWRACEYIMFFSDCKGALCSFFVRLGGTYGYNTAMWEVYGPKHQEAEDAGPVLVHCRTGFRSCKYIVFRTRD